MKSTVNQEFKNLISKIKFNYKLKQEEIAGKIGVTGPYLSDMINGRVPLTDSLQDKLYEVFSYLKDDDKVMNLAENKKEAPFEELPIDKKLNEIFKKIENLESSYESINRRQKALLLVNKIFFYKIIDKLELILDNDSKSIVEEIFTESNLN